MYTQYHRYYRLLTSLISMTQPTPAFCISHGRGKLCFLPAGWIVLEPDPPGQITYFLGSPDILPVHWLPPLGNNIISLYYSFLHIYRWEK